uniref:Putative secreted protein n=1 Tax=Ixodes ricinus TaxID=34613 RepID=A0A147BMB9_IXORI
MWSLVVVLPIVADTTNLLVDADIICTPITACDWILLSIHHSNTFIREDGPSKNLQTHSANTTWNNQSLRIASPAFMKRHHSRIALTRFLGPNPTFEALIEHEPRPNTDATLVPNLRPRSM